MVSTCSTVRDTHASLEPGWNVSLNINQLIRFWVVGLCTFSANLVGSSGGGTVSWKGSWIGIGPVFTETKLVTFARRDRKQLLCYTKIWWFFSLLTVLKHWIIKKYFIIQPVTVKLVFQRESEVLRNTINAIIFLFLIILFIFKIEMHQNICSLK